MTDQNLHTVLQYRLTETPNQGASYTSNLWTVDEVAASLTRHQRRILVETGLVVGRATLATVPNTARHILPADYLGLRRATWHGANGRYSPLRPMTWREADLAPTTQPFQHLQRPYGYLLPEDLTETLQIQVVPAAYDGGLVEIWYLQQGAALSNTGVEMVLPEALAATLVYATLGELLRKQGEAFDEERADWCDARAAEGIALAQASLIAGIR